MLAVVILTVALSQQTKVVNGDSLSQLDGPHLVLFYSSSCETPNCVKVLKVVDSIGDLGLEVYKCDLFFDSVLAKKEQLENPPVLRMYAHGAHHDFRGFLETSSVTRFVDRILRNETGIPIEDLRDEDYEAFVEQHQTIFLYFYMKNCQPCKLSRPAVESISLTLRDSYPQLKFASVDVSQSGITERFGVEEFPSFKIYNNGVVGDCRAQSFAKHDELLDCIERYLHPEEEPVAHVEKIRTVLDRLMFSEFVVVGYFQEKDESFRTFLDFGSKVRDVVNVFYTMDPSTETRLGVTHSNLVMFLPVGAYLPGMETYHIFAGPFSEDSLRRFVFDRLGVTIGQLTSKNVASMFWRRPMCLFIFEVSWKKEDLKSTQYLLSQMMAVARARPNVSFAYSTPQLQQELRNLNFGISLDYSEFGLGCLDSEGRKYVMPHDVGESLDFVDTFMAGGVPEYRMSTEARIARTRSVVSLTGHTFDRNVLGESSWLLFFYDSYSPAVEQAMRTFREFSSEYGMTPLRFGEMDVSTNDPHPMFYPHMVANPVLIYHSSQATSVFSMEFDKQNIFDFVFPLEESESHGTGEL